MAVVAAIVFALYYLMTGAVVRREVKQVLERSVCEELFRSDQ